MSVNGKRFLKIVCIVVLSAICIIGCSHHDLVVSAENWKFAVMCDTRGDNISIPGKTCLNDDVVRAIARDIKREGCELVIVPGDMVNGWLANGGKKICGISKGSTSYERQFANWKKAMAPCYGSGIKVYTVRGNHEHGWGAVYPPEPPYDPVDAPGLERAYIEAFGADNPDNGPPGEKDLTYRVTHKNACFFGLDEYATPHRVNQAWLDKQLAGVAVPNIFIFGHEPAFRTKHPDCLAYYDKARDAFWNSIGNAGARVYFCGHDHFYARCMVKDDAGHEIRQVLNGTGGAPLKDWSGRYEDSRVRSEFVANKIYGYNVITVGSRGVLVTFKRWDGGDTWTVIDSFSYSVP